MRFLLLARRGIVSRASRFAEPCPNLINTSQAPFSYEEKSAVVYEEFITPEEEKSIVKDVMERMRRRRYEKGHWDAVITNYKEIQLIPESLSYESQSLIKKTHSHLEQSHFNGKDSVVNDMDAKIPLQWLPCHAIDLQKNGKLSAHVDSIKFSGHIVAGLSLMSSTILRLKPAALEEISIDGHVDLLLPPRSLYVLSGVSRYNYTHEILPCGSTFQANETNNNGDEKKEIIVTRDQRISIIFRDKKV